MIAALRSSREQGFNGSIFYCIIILIIVVVYLSGRYFYELVDEPTNIAPYIISMCGGLAMMNNNSDDFRGSLCDPSDLFDGKDKFDIVTRIHQIENYYDLRYRPGIARGDANITATTNNTSHTSLRGLKMSVYAIDETILPFFLSAQDECDYMSNNLLNSLEEDGSNHIILLLTKKDKRICMACSKEIEYILTPGRVGIIIDQAQGLTWDGSWSEKKLVNIVDYCLKHILKYLEEGEPSFFENYGWYFFAGGYLFFYFSRRNSWRRQTNLNIRGKEKSCVNIQDMCEQEKEEALSLMKKYQCYSCPICLEDYEKSSVGGDYEDGSGGGCNSVEGMRYLGCDGKPIQLLRCGHSTCHKCWEEWMTMGRNFQSCPICKEDISGQ